MTGPEIKTQRNKKGLSQAKFAAELGISIRTLQRWETKGVAGDYLLKTSHPNRNEIPESCTDPFTSLIRSLELLRMLRDQLKEGYFLHD